MKPTPPPRSDLRGAARLAVDATAGLTDLVEAMHARIASPPGVSAPEGRTRGITGLVYKSIRGVTQLVGGSVDALLGLLEAVLAPGAKEGPPNPQREAVLAALNGVLGDHLAASHNPLATPMTLRRDGQALALEPAALAARIPDASPRLLVLLHGLCMNDRQWLREGHDHGAALARDLGFTPVYLHYNSGLPVAVNGLAFANLMQRLLDAWPCRVERLVLLGHSMGGLVARSALQQGAAAGQGWPQRVDDLVCLGTPHQGAPLERAGHWIDLLLGATPYAAPLARLGKVRSAGITDLRHGLPQPPLPAGVRCFALAGSMGAPGKGRGRELKDSVVGDGLVPVASALGQHADTARSLDFPPDHQWLAQGVNHMALLSDGAVYAQACRWLSPPPSASLEAPAS